MNKQRNVIYGKRQHALFGDRLALDIDNAFSVVAESLVSSFKEQEDFEGFKLACIVNFGLDTKITEEQFKKENAGLLSDHLYTEASENYLRHKEELRKQAVPVFKNIRQTQGSHVENVVVPFTDGRKAINVLTNLDKTISTEGEELTAALERTNRPRGGRRDLVPLHDEADGESKGQGVYDSAGASAASSAKRL